MSEGVHIIQNDPRFRIHKGINQQLEHLSAQSKSRDDADDSVIKIRIIHPSAVDQISKMNLRVETPAYMGDQQEDALVHSFLVSALMDIKQTSTWGDTIVTGRVRRKIREINPLMAPFTKTGQHPMVALSLVGNLLTVEAIKKIKDPAIRMLSLVAINLNAAYYPYLFNTYLGGGAWKHGDYGFGIIPNHDRMMQIHIPFSLQF